MPLNRNHHTLSQLLLFSGCVSEEQIKNVLLIRNEEEDIDIEEMTTQINRWNEEAMTSLQIESFQWIDNKTYYGWRPTVSTDDISKRSMTSLSAKQINFFKIFLNVSIENSGLSSLNAAHTLNRSVLLGLQNILTASELKQLFAILEKQMYIQPIANEEFEEKKDNDSSNKYYILGPRAFIDLKVWIESKTEHAASECILCSDYVMYKGFKCPFDNCPNIVHQQCIEQYMIGANGNNFKCPGCQRRIEVGNDVQNGIKEYVQILNHPNDAIEIINNLKERLSDSDNAEQSNQNDNVI